MHFLFAQQITGVTRAMDRGTALETFRHAPKVMTNSPDTITHEEVILGRFSSLSSHNQLSALPIIQRDSSLPSIETPMMNDTRDQNSTWFISLLIVLQASVIRRKTQERWKRRHFLIDRHLLCNMWAGILVIWRY